MNQLEKQRTSRDPAASLAAEILRHGVLCRSDQERLLMEPGGGSPLLIPACNFSISSNVNANAG